MIAERGRSRFNASAGRATLALLLAALAVAPAIAQTAPTRLRILAAADGEPLRRAKVARRPEGGPPRLPAPSARQDPPVFADDDGVVTIVAAPGTELRVSKAGYAPQIVRIPSPPPETIDVRLIPAAVIAGRVVDSRGGPAIRVSVVVRRVTAGAEPASAPIQAGTDDRGEFRFGGLEAGRYEVYTERGIDLTGVFDRLPPGGAPEAIAERNRLGRESASDVVAVTPGAGEHADVTLTRTGSAVALPFSEGGVVSGTVVDEYGEPAEGARVMLIAIGGSGISHMTGPAAVDDLGRYRLYQVPPERYLLAVAGADGAAFIRGGPPMPGGGFSDASATPSLPVYYPGTHDPSEGVSLAIERGREIPGMDMVVRTARGVRVFGTVVPVPGAQQQQVGLTPVVTWSAIALGPRAARVAADGSFEFINVPPGRYALQAVSRAATDRFGRPTDIRFAAQKILVGPDDAGPFALSPGPTSSISGRVLLEGDKEGVDSNDFRISALPVDPTEAPGAGVTSGFLRVVGGADLGVEPESDWTFRINGLSGPTRVGLSRAPHGWWLKQVRIGGIDAAVEPAAFGSAEASRGDVEIVISHSGATLTGRAVDASGRPAELYTVIVFATDRDQWFKGSSRVKTTTSGSDFGYILPSLPPGDYLVAAVEFSEIDPNADDRTQPDELARLASSAQRITLAEGQQRRIELKLSP